MVTKLCANVMHVAATQAAAHKSRRLRTTVKSSFLGCLWNAVQLHPEFASRSAPFYSFYSKMSVCLSFCDLDRTFDLQLILIVRMKVEELVQDCVLHASRYMHTELNSHAAVEDSIWGILQQLLYMTHALHTHTHATHTLTPLSTCRQAFSHESSHTCDTARLHEVPRCPKRARYMFEA
mmetsp:Transcript_33352/g.83069  ORF Transcript_33352/g.83069 Transcript_33352/m.83069 type:complete len:179 (-) Transcript_33352:96-632(-)